MDRAARTTCAASIRSKTRLHGNPVVIQLPIGAEDAFEGVIDLIRMQAIYWDTDTQA